MSEAQATITSREFSAWAAYDRLEPIGGQERAAQERHAELLATMANLTPGAVRANAGQAYRTEHFLPADHPRAQAAIAAAAAGPRTGLVADLRRAWGRPKPSPRKH